MADDIDTTPAQEPQAPSAVQTVLQLAAPRSLAVDDHMFRAVTNSGEASFRLQLFTAPGHRPVAVATQTPEEGASLTNAAEVFAAAVWEQHCPAEEHPPVWVQRLLQDAPPGFEDDSEFELVVFADAEPFELRGPGWLALTAAQLEELVGGPVATDRGADYVPPAPEPEPEARFEVMAVRELSRPHPFREPGCMPEGTPWWRRWWRQAVPVRGARDCCWYHGGDWHQVNRLAIAGLAKAEAAGITAEDMADFVDEYAKQASADRWEREALDSLFGIGAAIEPSRGGGFVNGQHRTQAMLDAGVRRTVVLRMVWPTSS